MYRNEDPISCFFEFLVSMKTCVDLLIYSLNILSGLYFFRGSLDSHDLFSGFPKVTTVKVMN